MKITLKNSVISKASNFIEQIKVKGKDTLALGKFKKLLNRRLQEAAEDEQTLLKEHILQGDKLDDTYQTEHTAWLNQDAEIEGGTYVSHIDDVDRIINAWVEKNEIAGPDLDGYLALHEAFEDAKALADEAKED